MATAESEWFTFKGVLFSEVSFLRVWLLALAAYGVGDVVTTIAIVWFSPLYMEANPVVAGVIDLFGGSGFVALKLLVFYICLGISLWGGARNDDPVLFYGPPITLGLFGLVATAHNLGLML